VSETPRDQDRDADVSGRAPFGDGSPGRDPDDGSGGSAAPTTGPPAGAANTDPASAQARRQRMTFGPVTEPDPATPAGRRQRRRRRLFVAGIAVAAALIVVALCAGALAIVAGWNGARDRADDARQDRRLRETACLELEKHLNSLSPPGANISPQAKAAAVQSENAAVRIFIAEIRSQHDQDAWRQLLDARTAYADALNQQAKTRTPAFFVIPRTGDGRAVSDELIDSSPASCAGSIRRLAAPDL
jgi:hypothetical protein